MNKIKTLGRKITILVTLLVTITVASITAVSFFRNRKTVQDYYASNIESYNLKFAQEINNHFDNIADQVTNISDKERLFVNPYLQLRDSYTKEDSLLNRDELYSYFKDEVFKSLFEKDEIVDIYIINTEVADPTIIFRSSNSTPYKTLIPFKNIDNDAVDTHKKTVDINTLVEESNQHFTHVTYPIKLPSNAVVGHIVIKMDIQKIFKSVQLKDVYFKNVEIVSDLLFPQNNDIFKALSVTANTSSNSFDSTTRQNSLRTKNISYAQLKQRWERDFISPFLELKKAYSTKTDTSINRRKELHDYFKNEVFPSVSQKNDIIDLYLIDTKTADSTVIFQYSKSNSFNTPFSFNEINQDTNSENLKNKQHITHVIYPISISSKVIGQIVVIKNSKAIFNNISVHDYYSNGTSIFNDLISPKQKASQVLPDQTKLISVNANEKISSIKTRDIIYDLIKENWEKEEPGKAKIKSGNKVHICHWGYNHDLGIAIISSVAIGKDQYNHGNFNFITLLIGFGIIIITYLLSSLFSRILVYPIIKLKKILNLIGKGVLPKEINTLLEDEIGDMIRTVNGIVKSLRNTAFFAQQIGKGEFDTHFSPVSNQDILGSALVEMKESLQIASSKDEVRNWIIEGLAEIGTILRNFDTKSEISNEVIQFICHRVNALQGAMFIVEYEDENNPSIELRSTYAFGKKKNLKRSFEFGEGLIGQAAVEKTIILRSEIPENYTIIKSGLLGDQHPSHLLIVPLIYDDKVYGVIELASFNIFDSDVTEFMEEVGKIISRTIFNLNVSENTRKLLEESQRLGAELSENKAQLESNAKEMANTQVILTETNSKLQVQISKVKEAQERQTSLLENASEVIFIFNEEGVVNYVSPSVIKILGYQENDILGSVEISRIKEENKKSFEKFVNSIVDNPQAKYTLQYQYYKKEGDVVWLEAVGINQLSNPAIKGVVVNVTDITIKRQAEEEQRKRSQMQQLSENSTDVIMRLGLDGSVFYANPRVTDYTGLDVETVLKKTIDKTIINERTDGSYVNLLEQVKKEKVTTSLEVDFKGENENRIFQLQGIPEFDTQNELESVLVISHDVTEEKLIEREIKEKNKQIEDSIYYAENIQEALLPNSKHLSDLIPESFILFKPRDIVSGDFPWFVEHNGFVYLAAVDCTGHGVPGAMISLVGYFLLNNILREDKTPTPSEVLDELNDLVTSTFRQNDEDSKLKDGMDMVLSRIDLKNNTFECASANRPIYIYDKNNSLTEIRGDKFPIGGGDAYSNRHPFTNHELKIEVGTGMYFFSDGLQDQFNEDSTKKFGTKAIREIIKSNHSNNVKKVHESLEKAFLEWKGNGEQTDDILLIGVKF